MRLSSPAAKSFYAILILASSLFATPPVRATEYGLGDYLLGYSLPMAGYTPPPGIYFSDTFYLYEGSANANIKFPIGRNIDAGVSYNFLFNIVQTTWVTDVKTFLGGSLGFGAHSFWRGSDVGKPFSSRVPSVYPANLAAPLPLTLGRQRLRRLPWLGGGRASLEPRPDPVLPRPGLFLNRACPPGFTASGSIFKAGYTFLVCKPESRLPPRLVLRSTR